MTRPHIICHMVMSVDGKVTGDFLFRPERAAAPSSSAIKEKILRRNPYA